MNIALFLQMAAEACPDRSALTHDGKHYTYLELFESANKVAERFSHSGCRFVSVLDVSSPAVPIALMGAAMAGIPYVPLNYRLSTEQLSELLARIEPAFLIVDDSRTNDFDEVEATVLGRQALLDDLLSSPEVSVAWKEDPSAVAIQLFTSGTTGTPKAAILRHEHLVSYILGSVEFMGASEEQSTLVSVPPYHIAGISAVMSSIYACRRIVQLPDFDPAEWLSLCANERVTNAFVVPTMLKRIIEELDESSFDPATLMSLEALAYGGGKMPVPVIERALELLPEINFTNAYGLTETSSTITLLDPDDHRQALDHDDLVIRARLGSVGKALPSVEIQIRDDEGNELGPFEAGEIYVRGPQVSGEYLERNALVDEGWFPTRDAGYLDDHDYLYLSGRADDVIVRGGENISPAEIEDLLHAHNAIDDAAAVGIPSEEWGEAVALAVVLKNSAELSEDEIVSLIRTSLRSSRVPEVIRFTSELPYSDTGKLLRRVVKTWFD
ncbi:MAG: class I adenylate-forming enzyme family protein [Pseudomonadales bacterium]|jgi:acyl-CoA synthetase (AMP-forming)/AMP-acid ligase II|nr:class I adenylate-forming enzyme family protein [Pseudomonadales bacterium]MDP7315721.1 class I adenylate-forming enzyme family protein [Pseudomonadales bacterium]MDP7452028.1 class I adenylate-forming enzyme family protein [Arenicellales bacterium]MDP7575469.1 class I adenylate-forming enzyme family protein [Pseudomonadales bacterium]HJP49413.1 class I adenylate-forming enzyme family protein [Pseudomonadales bacterium]|tara:strand:+ start:68 stop:1561 length:1494 start_codon:yes stop_codon:yes gene_type:complete